MSRSGEKRRVSERAQRRRAKLALPRVQIARLGSALEPVRCGTLIAIRTEAGPSYSASALAIPSAASVARAVRKQAARDASEAARHAAREAKRFAKVKVRSESDLALQSALAGDGTLTDATGRTVSTTRKAGLCADGSVAILVLPTRLREVPGFVDSKSGQVVRSKSVARRPSGAGRGQTAARRAMLPNAIARKLADKIPDVACASTVAPMTARDAKDLAVRSAHAYLRAMSEPVIASAIGTLIAENASEAERALADSAIQSHPLAIRLSSLDGTISARRYALHLSDTLRADASEVVKASLVREASLIVGFSGADIARSRSVGCPSLVRQSYRMAET